MAGSIKGSVKFKAGGEDYTLLLDFNALCDLETDFPDIMNGKFELSSPKAIRRVFQAGLAEHHPDISDRDAGALIHDLGLARAAELISDSFAASFPATGGEEASRPPKAPPSPGAGSAP
jgi:hypothetical protein